MVRKLKQKSNGNTKDIIKQAQQMQNKMLEVQEMLKDKEVESSVGGGAVVVKANGQKELLSLEIKDEILKEAVEENDKEMLQDLIMSAVKEVMRQAEDMAEQEMSKVTGGIEIPGLI